MIAKSVCIMRAGCEKPRPFWSCALDQVGNAGGAVARSAAASDARRSMARMLFTLVICAVMSAQAAAQSPHEGAPSALAGLRAAAEIARDNFGIAHIQAGNDHDLYFMQGYIHAQDRLFQMDVSRRL